MVEPELLIGEKHTSPKEESLKHEIVDETLFHPNQKEEGHIRSEGCSPGESCGRKLYDRQLEPHL